jgi:protein SCO1/2
MLSTRFQSLQDEWKGDAHLKLVSFSVDPARDTAAILKAYAGSLHADETQWTFLTGKKKDLYRFIREGFKLTAEQDPKGDPGFEFIHTTRLILVDGNGMVRGLYDGQEDEDFRKLQKDIVYLMRAKGKP